jgi:DNA adenine methylase
VHQSQYYKSPDKYYYYIRDEYSPASNAENAARLIFLNKTCYNGLYRVNRSGLFNVPHGTHVRPTVCSSSRLRTFSDILQRSDAEIICDEYRNVIQRCKSPDVVYLDPPYFPLSKTAYFKDYTKEQFGHYEQVTLSTEFKRLSNLRCTVLLSNSSSPFIFDLYKDYSIMTVSTTRHINCDASNRLRHQELLISNKRLVAINTPSHAQKMPQL